MAAVPSASPSVSIFMPEDLVSNFERTFSFSKQMNDGVPDGMESVTFVEPQARFQAGESLSQGVPTLTVPVCL
jgi:hypothetical protein